MTRQDVRTTTKLSEDRLRELSRLRPARFLLSLALDWALIACGFALFGRYPSVPAFLAGSVLVGIGQHGLVVLGHEAVHFNVCSNRRLNDWIGGLFCFFPIGLTVSIYRDFHFPHHRDPGGVADPELPIRRAMGRNWEPPFSLRRGLFLWGLSFFGASLRELATFVARLPRGNKRELAAFGMFWVCVCAGVYREGLWAFLGLWYYAQVSTYFSALRIQAWYEHSLTHSDTNRYALPGPVFRLVVPHNIWIHYEHHLYPNIPFYLLQEARAEIAGEKIYPFFEMTAELSAPPSQAGGDERNVA